MVSSSGHLESARVAVLKYAQAKTKREQILSSLDSRIAGIGGFALARGRFFGFESDESFATRISGSEPIQSMLQKAFMEHSTRESAFSQFSRILQESLSVSLASTIPDKESRERKAEGIARAVVKQLSKAPQTEQYHLFAKATSEALSYQTGMIDIVYSGVARGVITLAQEKVSEVTTEREAIAVISEKYLSDIQVLNAQKALRAEDSVDFKLNTLTTLILSKISSRDMARSSKTSKQIAREVIESTASREDPLTPITLKHPLNELWVEMGKASATPVSISALRARFISNVALAIHHNKHYDPAESLRKAEHIFSYLLESADPEAVKLYVDSYRSCLPVDAAQITLLKATTAENAYKGPKFERVSSSEDRVKHCSYLLGKEIEAVNAKTLTIGQQFRTEADSKGIGAGRVSADAFIRGISSNKNLMLNFSTRALFESDKTRLSDEERLASYRVQIEQYLEGRLDSLSTKADWIAQAAKKIASELERLYSSDLRNIERRREGFGIQHEAPAAMDESLFKFSEYESRAVSRGKFEETLSRWCLQIREKLNLRPSSPDIRQIEAAFNAELLHEMATAFFNSAPQQTTSADFQIALTSALVSSLSGTAGLDEHLHSTQDARERLRAFTASVVERFISLADVEDIRQNIQIRREALGLSKDDEMAARYIDYRRARS